jgi:hypothetical protein
MVTWSFDRPNSKSQHTSNASHPGEPELTRATSVGINQLATLNFVEKIVWTQAKHKLRKQSKSTAASPLSPLDMAVKAVEASGGDLLAREWSRWWR